MGALRFLIHSPEFLADWPEVHAAYMTGADGRIFPGRIEVDGNIISYRRPVSDSGKFQVACPVTGYGRPILSTASLPERERPYLLPLELARGKIVQLRNQVSQWELAGMLIPDDYLKLIATAQRFFSRAALNQAETVISSQLAQQAIIAACEAAEALGDSYSVQALAGRHQRYQTLPVLFGCELGQATPDVSWNGWFPGLFNAAGIRICWKEIEAIEGEYNWDLVDRQVEWCEAHKLVMRAGPLLDFGPQGLPAWLAKWEHDPFNLQSFVCDFIETAMARYTGRIRTWEVAARGNTGGALTLQEDQRLSLLARVLDLARQRDEESTLLIRVDQPWGEYFARGQHRLLPLQMVDALIRSGVGLNGVNLEIAMGYQPRGTPARDMMDLSRLIDQWSALGIPLFVTLAYPSSRLPDPLAHADLEVDPHLWDTVADEEAQAVWADHFLPLLIAKPAIMGAFWSHVSDAVPHEIPHAGLFRADGVPKEILPHLKLQRQAYRLKN